MAENEKPKILWVDDEIDLLRSQITFLESRGYDVSTVLNGHDAVDIIKEVNFDAILLDEIMVGMDGLSTLAAIKEYDPSVPVVMVTKSTEETLMDEAYFSEISDFLVKPVNPHQILSTLKKILELEELRKDKFVSGFGNYYNATQGVLNDIDNTFKDWADMYVQMSKASIEIDDLKLDSVKQLQIELERESDVVFSDFLIKNYPSWLKGENDPPVLSYNLLKNKVFPLIDQGKNVYLIIIDCLRLDQWLAIEPKISDRFLVDQDCYCGMVPSATLYARNAIFSGLTPADIDRHYPSLFSEVNTVGESLNKDEEQFLNDNLERNMPNVKKCRFYKMQGREDDRGAEKMLQSIPRRPLTSYIFNFVDAITHESGKQGILDMLAPTTAGLRRLALSWFMSSPLDELLTKLSQDKDAVVVITSDHGSRITSTPAVVYADKKAIKSPRYWLGRDLRQDNTTGSFLIHNPEEFGLPESFLSKTYILALADHHLVFSHYLNKFDKKFTGGFFHGGVSMGELIIPVCTLYPK